MRNEPNARLGGAQTKYRYVACYFLRPSTGERYAAIAHGWIVRGREYIGCTGYETLGEAVEACKSWEESRLAIGALGN